MSDTFQSNYKNAIIVIKNITSILGTIKDNTNGSEAQRQLSRVKQYFAQAQEALKVMRNTASLMNYNSKIQAMGSVREIEQTLATIKKDIARVEVKISKSALIGSVRPFVSFVRVGRRGKEEEDGPGFDPAE